MVTTKGQVTIPKPPGDRPRQGRELRGRWRWPGHDPQGYKGPETNRPPTRFARLRGRATSGLITDEIMALTRGDE